MSKQKTINNSFRVRLDTFLAHTGRIIGWIGLVFWALPGIVGLSDLLYGTADSAVDRAIPFVCLALAALHGLLIWSAGRRKGLIDDFRLYCAMLAKSEDKSVVRLTEKLNLPLQTVLDQLEKMCRRGYFNGYLDYQDQCIHFSSVDAPQEQVVVCPGCGARNNVHGPVGQCRYCGAPLTR